MTYPQPPHLHSPQIIFQSNIPMLVFSMVGSTLYTTQSLSCVRPSSQRPLYLSSDTGVSFSNQNRSKSQTTTNNRTYTLCSSPGNSAFLWTLKAWHMKFSSQADLPPSRHPQTRFGLLENQRRSWQEISQGQQGHWG